MQILLLRFRVRNPGMPLIPQKDLVWRFHGTSTSTPAPRTRNREPSLTNTRTSTGNPNGCHHYLEPGPSAPAHACTCLWTPERSRPTPRTQGRLQLPWVLYQIYPNVSGNRTDPSLLHLPPDQRMPKSPLLELGLRCRILLRILNLYLAH